MTSKYTPLCWAEKACATMMNDYAPAALPPEGRWHYHQGVFLSGMKMIWEKTGNSKYLDYIQGYVDSLVQADGSFEYRDTELDSIQAGVLLFDLYKNSGEQKYKIAADTLINFLTHWKKNPVGGFWHKEIYPNQMWLDGLYMAGPFAVQYGKEFNRPELFDLVVGQAELMIQQTKDPRTGLLYHAWDQSREAVWADPETGLSPEFWGRSLGWIGAALVDILDYLPANHSRRNRLVELLTEFVAAIAKFQDQETGMWYQVVDKGSRPDNWLEHSCSCLYVYAIAKAVRKGYIGEGYRAVAEKGFAGITAMAEMDESGRVTIPEICIGTGVGDYDHYVARPRSQNDLHGVGAFLFACAEMIG
ncbi:MAG TPA: glycoside hydrolase family 88 protein [Bacillota bacterium]|nr:glycoside hydrolase family 88 protein [Bacillota bacterium]